MKAYRQLDREKLLELKKELTQQFDEVKACLLYTSACEYPGKFGESYDFHVQQIFWRCRGGQRCGRTSG